MPVARAIKKLGIEWQSSHSIMYKGQMFSSIRDLAQHLGLPYDALYDRINRLQWVEERWAEPAGNSLYYKGKEFKSILHLSTLLGVNYNVLYRRIKNNVPENQWGDPPSEGAPISYQGIEYPSITALSEALGVPFSALYQRIRRNLPEDRWTEPVRMMSIDITGCIFGRLTAVSKIDQNESHSNTETWIFKCVCGVSKPLPKKSVMSGNTSSCGCLQRELSSERNGNRDMIGRIFGNLKVVREGPALVRSQFERRLTWVCKCLRCGNPETHPILGKNLRNGNTKNCGCTKTTRDLTGLTFYRLTILRLHEVKNNERIWECQCSCAKKTVKYLSTGILVSGATKSCGCLASEKAVLNFRNEGIDAYNEDPSYAARTSYVYLVNVLDQFEKIGIAFDVQSRGRGDYKEVYWQWLMTRAECWAVEQVALNCTIDWSVRSKSWIEANCGGFTEFRENLDIDWTIELLEDLVRDCCRLGWKEFYYRHFFLSLESEG